MNHNLSPRRLRKIFWSPAATKPGSFFTTLKSQSSKSNILVRIFYIFNFFHWMLFFPSVTVLNATVVVDPVWPIFWMPPNSEVFFAHLFFNVNFLASLLALLFVNKKSARIFVFVSLFFLTAMFSSDIVGWERIGSHTYLFSLVAFLFIFLPDQKTKKRKAAWQTVFLLTLVQMTVLSAYVGSAIWRIRESIVAALDNNSLLPISPTALSVFISWVKYASDGIGLLGPMLVKNIYLSGPLMVLATLFELSCLFIMFKPRLYRLWGFFLLFLHLSFVLIFNFPFYEQLSLVGIFLVASPFTENNLFD